MFVNNLKSYQKQNYVIRMNLEIIIKLNQIKFIFFLCYLFIFSFKYFLVFYFILRREKLFCDENTQNVKFL